MHILIGGCIQVQYLFSSTSLKTYNYSLSFRQLCCLLSHRLFFRLLKEAEQDITWTAIQPVYKARAVVQNIQLSN